MIIRQSGRWVYWVSDHPDERGPLPLNQGSVPASSSYPLILLLLSKVFAQPGDDLPYESRFVHWKQALDSIVSRAGIYRAGNQCSILYQCAKLLFGSMVMGSRVRLDVIDRFVLHRESFQNDDADILVAQIPELTLSQFH
jgi:hypothetical protein